MASDGRETSEGRRATTGTAARQFLPVVLGRTSVRHSLRAKEAASVEHAGSGGGNDERQAFD